MSSFSRASDGTTSSAPAESCLLHLHVSLSSGPYLSLMIRYNSRCAGGPHHDRAIVPCQSIAGQTSRACRTLHLPGAELRPALERRARSLCCSLHFHYTPPLYLRQRRRGAAKQVAEGARRHSKREVLQSGRKHLGSRQDGHS